MSSAMKRLAARAGFAVLVAVIAVWSLFPFYWALVSSLKVGADLFEADLVPRRISFESYTGIFVEQPFGRNLLNSLIVASATVALATALACFAAYALGRVSFRGRGLVLLAILGVSMFPQVAVLSGLFEVITWLRLYDNLGALVISLSLIHI